MLALTWWVFLPQEQSLTLVLTFTLLALPEKMSAWTAALLVAVFFICYAFND